MQHFLEAHALGIHSCNSSTVLATQYPTLQHSSPVVGAPMCRIQRTAWDQSLRSANRAILHNSAHVPDGPSTVSLVLNHPCPPSTMRLPHLRLRLHTSHRAPHMETAISSVLSSIFAEAIITSIALSPYREARLFQLAIAESPGQRALAIHTLL